MNKLASPKSRAAAAASLAVFAAVYVALYWATHSISTQIEPKLVHETLREKAAFRIASSVAFAWLSFAALIIFLRFRGKTLGNLGWRLSASLGGWVVAAATFALFAGLLSFGPLREAPMLTDWSFFRIASALAVGVSAGICEEAIFRGFVITEARTAGLPASLQAVLSAFLFGLAHFGWGTIGTSAFNPAVAMGSMLNTAILGALLASAYLAGRRSLAPVIAAHAAIDFVIEPWLILFALGGGFAQTG